MTRFTKIFAAAIVALTGWTVDVPASIEVGALAASSAAACDIRANPALCAEIAPEGHRFSGNRQIPLRKSVRVCHPNWDNLARKWFSYAIFVDGQLPQVVASLRRTGSWNQEVELREGQRCHERKYGDGWMFAVYDPCVVEGYNVLRIARPTPNGVLDDPSEWQIVTGRDGKPLLFSM